MKINNEKHRYTADGGIDAWRQNFNLRPRRFGKGAAVFVDGATSNDIFLIVSGVVKLSYVSESGDPVVFGFRRAGQMLMPTGPVGTDCSFSAAALTEVLLYHFQPRSTVAVERLLMSQLRLEISNSIAELAELRIQSAQGRLELLLRRVADLVGSTASVGGQRSFRMPMTNRETATLISVTPEHLSRLKKKMHADGLLRCEGRVWTIRTTK
jgi:CRP-like cAMP-binding protein